jgi:hypothetical protein
MSSTRNFHPEWGYLAPSPIFIRTARIILIAVTVGTSRGERAMGEKESRRLFNYQPLYGPDVPAEYYPRRGYSGYYREPRWGGYYSYGGFDYR